MIVVQARSLVQRVRAVPGVVAATLSNDLPLDGSAGAVFYTAEGQPPVTAQNVPRAYIHTVSPDFFATLGIPLAQGRTFADNELTQQATAIVVSDQVVKRFWPGQDAIGKRLKLGAAGSTNETTCARQIVSTLIKHAFRRPATPADSVLGVRPAVVLEPADVQILGEMLRWANQERLSVVVRGAGTKLGWGNPPVRVDAVLSTLKLR